MKTTVVIPTYNSCLTIESAINSVLAQSVSADEILVLDDGSTDCTRALLAKFRDRATILEQPNRGVAYARNVLCQRARGDFIAFLDHDDIWHPDYLATQTDLCKAHPSGAAFFTGHENFHGFGDHQWQTEATQSQYSVEVIEPLHFITRYHRAPGPFASMSFCCVTRKILKELGPEPFSSQVSGVDDYHLYHKLLLLGPIVYDPTPLVAYRITQGAQSANLLKAVMLAVQAMELLSPVYQGIPDRKLSDAFKSALTSQRREYARILMGAGRTAAARRQLWLSIIGARQLKDLAKSLTLASVTFAPKALQPQWPSEWKMSHSANICWKSIGIC